MATVIHVPRTCVVLPGLLLTTCGHGSPGATTPAPESTSGASTTSASRNVASDTATVYLQYQVEKQAQLAPGFTNPEYPDALRTELVQGQVVATFVVDATGLVDMSTLTVLASTHPLFTQAVRTALARYRYYPAEIGGRKVRQRVEQTFRFAVQP